MSPWMIALDPGPEKTGWVIYHAQDKVAGESGVMSNQEVLNFLMLRGHNSCEVAIEMIASYGMAVGKEVFETCVWIGRFMQVAGPQRVRLVYRKDVKMHLCGTPRAKDTNIRQALIDKLGAQGTKKEPGPTYGVKSHAWAALAVAVTASETA